MRVFAMWLMLLALGLFAFGCAQEETGPTTPPLVSDTGPEEGEAEEGEAEEGEAEEGEAEEAEAGAAETEEGEAAKPSEESTE